MHPYPYPYIFLTNVVDNGRVFTLELYLPLFFLPPEILFLCKEAAQVYSV